MRKYTTAALSLLLLAGASGHALAWDDEGHKVVALIAEHYLSPLAKNKVSALLASDTDPLTAHDIASESTWADKYADSDKKTTKARYDATHDWHFADINAARPNIPEACFGQPALASGTLASQGPAKACVIDKVSQFWAEVADPKTGPAERLTALKFLLNLVGDIHQPLRVADESNSHGAALMVAASSITPGDLFDYWDVAYVYAIGPDPKAVADQLVAKVSGADAHLWASGTPQLWALEAHQLGVDRAYGISGTPNDKGQLVLPDSDVARLEEFGNALRMRYTRNLALAHSPASAEISAALDGNPDTFWTAPAGSHHSTLEAVFSSPVTFNRTITMEWLNAGQRIQKYSIDIWTGTVWKTVVTSGAIGHKKIDIFPPVTASRVRLNILSSTDAAAIREFQMYNTTEGGEPK